MTVAASTSTGAAANPPMLCQPSTSDDNPADLLFDPSDLHGESWQMGTVELDWLEVELDWLEVELSWYTSPMAVAVQ